MMGDDARERIRKGITAPPAPPLEATRRFLHGYCSDAASIDALHEDIRKRFETFPRPILDGLAGIEGLLEGPPPRMGVLSHLVAFDANWVLDDPSDEGASLWLHDLAEFIRSCLGERQPPRRSGNAE